MAQYASPYLGMGNNPVSFIDPTGGMDGDGQTKQIDPKAAEQIKQMRDQFGSNFGGIEWQDIIATMSQNEGSGWNRTHAWLMSGSNMGYDSWVGDLNRQMAEIGMVYSEKRNAYGKWADLEFASTGKTHIEGGSIVKFTTELTTRWIPFSGNVAQGGGGSDFWSTTAGLINSYTSPKADFVGGAAENKIGQILLDRGKYGSLHPETIIRTPVANISVSTKLLQNTGTALKWGGRAFGAVGLVGTYAQWQTGAIGNTEAALDATFGAIGFLPGYGWAVSGAYFLIAKPLYNYSTKP